MEKRRREMLRDRILAGRRSELTRSEILELLDYCDKFDQFVEEVEHEEQVRTR